MALKTLEGKDLFASLDTARSIINELDKELSILEDRIIDADKRIEELENVELPAAYKDGLKAGEEKGFEAGQLEQQQQKTEI